MSNKNKQKLSLDHQATYHIQVPGSIDANWSDWGVEMKIAVDYDEHGFPISTLTGEFDQAALQGLLRRLYSLGIPLISVNWLDDK